MPYEPEFHRQGAVLLTRTGDASVWQFRNETGEGTMTTYELFPGVALSFNDFHMASFDSSFSTRQRLFAVDYCREGRVEYAAAAAEIAAQVGYRNAGKFAAAFKKATGCTPLEYRQEACPKT